MKRKKCAYKYEKALDSERQDTTTWTKRKFWKFVRSRSRSRREVAPTVNALARMNNLAGVLRSLGKYEEADDVHGRALERREKVLDLKY